MSTPFLVLLSSVLTGAAQTPPTEKSPPPRFTHAVRSPEVHPDGRVTFRFRAPNAKKVLLAREGATAQVAMTKDERGTWSLTMEPLPPDLYVYRFVVDGVLLADPCNPLAIPKVMGGQESIVHVPGPASLSWEVNNVPHGTLHRHCFRSKVLGEDQEFWVYTPPGYDAAGSQKYPVLYLLHGVTDTAAAWTTAGRAHVILDNLIAQKKTQPMLLVMPLGYGFPHAADRIGDIFNGRLDQQKISDLFGSILLEEVLPEVERTYRVNPDRQARAIAGLSMGGSQALYLGLKHRDRFAWIGSFSGAFIMFNGQFAKWFPEVNGSVNAQLRLLWLSCGTEDFLLGSNRKCKEWLQSKEVRCTAIETPGGHTWTVWRRNLTEFAPLLFQEKAP
jgi:enterochelin esterase family protein